MVTEAMEASFDTNCMYFDGKRKRTLLHTNISVSSIIRIPRYALGPYAENTIYTSMSLMLIRPTLAI